MKKKKQAAAGKQSEPDHTPEPGAPPGDGQGADLIGVDDEAPTQKAAKPT